MYKMVQLFVKFSPEGVDEWGIVELQGELETRDQMPFDQMHIGDLYFNKKGTPQMIIGHHLLTGKVEKLDKPYAVLKKHVSESHSMDLEQTDSEQLESQSTEYRVVAMVTRKVIFKNRPKPIVTKTLPKKQ